MLRWLPLSPRSWPRAIAPSLLAALSMAGSATAQAQGPSPLPATSELHELSHEISVRVTAEGTQLSVERRIENPGAFPALLELPIELPCEATLDDLRLADPSAPGGWSRASILDPSQASAAWDAWLDRPGEIDAARMRNPDSALLMTRDGSGCEAELSLFPVPAFGEQTFAYEVFIPHAYGDGEYSLELPRFADFGLPATLHFDPQRVEPGFELRLDGAVLDAPLPVDASSSHALRLRADDEGRSSTQSASIDLAALLPGNAPARELLSLEARSEPLATLFHARFDAPRRLSELPPVRRVVIVRDTSRSLSASMRREIEHGALAYLEALAAHVEASAQPEPEVELLDFAHALSPAYHAFVPLSWAIEDLDAIEVQPQNGSDLDLALAHARALLSTAAAAEAERGQTREGADWIIVFSDLELREAFDLEAEAEASAAHQARIHVASFGAAQADFAPASHDDPWTQLALRSGGMGWSLSESGNSSTQLGHELVAPRRVWSPQLAVDLEDGRRELLPIEEQFLSAGERYGELLELPTLAHTAVFSGEVWGQPRAWSTRPDQDVARRIAGRVASDADFGDAPSSVRTLLAHYAQVITPFSAAYLERDGAGALPLARTRWPAISFGTCGGSYSTHCGGGRGCYASSPHYDALETLVQAVLDSCPAARAGQLVIETTSQEVVDVRSADSCVEAGSWRLDLRTTELAGHKRFTLDFIAGQVGEVETRALG